MLVSRHLPHLFQPTTSAFIIALKYQPCSFNKKATMVIFTLLLPSVAELVAVKTVNQILNECLQTDFRAKSVDYHS